MADSTEVVTPTYDVDKGKHSLIIKNAEVLVPGGMAGLILSTGKIENNDDSSDLMPIGRVEGASDGDNTNHLTGSTTYSYKATVRGGDKMYVSVTGASAITDVGKLVYMTDNQTWTLTKPTIGVATGIVVAWVSSTYCWVYVYSMEEQIMLANIGGALTGYEYMPLGTFGTNALAGTNAVTLATYPVARRHYKIISLHARPTTVDAGAVAGSQALNLAIDSTDTTGGVLTLAYTSCDAQADMATIIDATAITAANEVHINSTVTLKMAASGTGFTDAQLSAFEIWAVVQYLPGA